MKTQDQILEQALAEVIDRYHGSREAIRRDFSAVVVATERRAHELYTESQREAGESAIRLRLLRRLPPNPSADDAVQAASELFVELNDFFLSRAQSRKSRGGRSLERILQALFLLIECPFEHQPKIDGRPDFVLPSVEFYQRNPMDCLVLTAKRTVRERWRQIVTEGAKGLGFFLATLDRAVSAEQIADMMKHRIRLVVPEAVKQSVEHYRTAANVLTFEDFFSLHVDPSVTKWPSRAGSQ